MWVPCPGNKGGGYPVLAGVPRPPVDRHTPVKTVSSLILLDAGGTYTLQNIEKDRLSFVTMITGREPTPLSLITARIRRMREGNNFSLSKLAGGGVVPIPGVGGGYPVPGLGRGVPHPRPGRGVPCLRSGWGVPCLRSGWWGTPSWVQMGGTSSQVWTGGTPFCRWGGIPHPRSRLGGYPHLRSGGDFLVEVVLPDPSSVFRRLGVFVAIVFF